MNKENIAKTLDSKPISKMSESEINLLAQRLLELLNSIDSNCDLTYNGLVSFVNYTTKNYGYLTDKGLMLALHYGAMGEFGDYYRINQKSMNLWVKQFAPHFTAIKQKGQSEGHMNQKQYCYGLMGLIRKGIDEGRFKDPDGMRKFARKKEIVTNINK